MQAALHLPCLTVQELARTVGIPRATLQAYKLGTRRMPPIARARLAAVLMARAAEIRRLATVLTDPDGPTP